MVGSLVLRLRFDPVLIRGLSRTPRLRPTVFRADLLRARPPPFDSFMVSSSAHSARQTTGAARLGHLPRCYPSVRPAALSPCVFSPHPGLGGRWAQRSMVGAVFLRPGSVALVGTPGFRYVLHVARVPPGRNSHSPSTSVPAPFLLVVLPCWPWHR